MAASTLIERFPSLAALRAESAVSIASTFIRAAIRADEPVFLEGGAPGHVFLLADGLIKTVKHSSRTDPSAMEFLVPGRFFGMIAVMDRKPYPVSAIAVRDSVVYRVAAARFEELMQTYPDFRHEVFMQIGDHVRNAQALRVALEEPAPRRIAMILCGLHETVGPELRIRREDLAAMAGTTLGTVVRELARLRRSGVVETGWKLVKIKDIRSLRRSASSQNISS